ncbi:MAG: glycosyltransferase [Candidatus Caldatribacteriota bacterium]
MQTYIIIPNYIVTEELKELATNTIKSFRNSSKDIVIIAVDDGSPMDCTFLKKLSDIYIKNKENSGFAISCNNGFKRAFKELGKKDGFIVCANNDIEVFPGWQEAMQRPFIELDNVAVSGIKHTKARDINGQELKDIRGSKITEGGLIGDCMQDGGLWMSTKKVLKKVGIFDEQFIRGGYEDVDIFLRMRDTFGMKIIMSEERIYWHKEGATRWNCENNGFINNFGRESKSIEVENLEKFIRKWGFNPHQKQIWYSTEIKS